MKLHAPGTSTSEVEVLGISSHGVWLGVREKEYFLPYEDYPWFQDARVSDILSVELLHEGHLYWPKLDVDLETDSLEHPERYPLVAK